MGQLNIELLWKGPDGLPKKGVRLVSVSLSKSQCLVGHIIDKATGKSLRYYWDRRKSLNSRPVIWVKHVDGERKTRSKYAIELTKAFVLRAIELGILDMAPGENEFGQQSLGVLYRYAATVIIGRNRSETSLQKTYLIHAKDEDSARREGRRLIGKEYPKALIRNITITKG